jgi:cephalosporin hydroxylase
VTTSISISRVRCVFRKVRSYVKSYRGVRTLGPCCDIDRALHLVFASDGGFLQPLQRPAEIRNLLAILSKRKPAVVVEIGTASGGNLFLFTRVAAKDALIVSIDLPAGRFGGGYPRWRIPLYRAFARPHQKVHLIRGDSHAPETLAKLSAILNGRKIDFLFVDGDHTYQGVSQDFNLYHPFVHPGGIIAFHDIVEHSSETQCNVNRFWQQIKTRYDHVEIVEDWKAGFAGIGLITSNG